MLDGNTRKRARRRNLWIVGGVVLTTIIIVVVVVLVVVFNFDGSSVYTDDAEPPPSKPPSTARDGDKPQRDGVSSDTMRTGSSVKQQPDSAPTVRPSIRNQERLHELVIRSEARTQTVAVYTPQQYYGSGEGVPLLIFLHGLGGTGPQIARQYGMTDAADRMGFAYVAPSAVNNGKRARAWCATDECCCERGASAAKYASDSLFLGDMMKEIINEFPNVDEDRIYVAGVSNGGYMSYRLACDYSEIIAAIMPICGGHFTDLARSCRATSPVHALHIHGTRDTVVSYEPTRYRHGAKGNLQSWCAGAQTSILRALAALIRTFIGKPSNSRPCVPACRCVLAARMDLHKQGNDDKRMQRDAVNEQKRFPAEAGLTWLGFKDGQHTAA